MVFSVPSKTFLAGEYLAVLGGPSLVIATTPRFWLAMKSADQADEIATAQLLNKKFKLESKSRDDRFVPLRDWSKVFHPESPVGLFLSSDLEKCIQQNPALKEMQFQFVDPYQSVGNQSAMSVSESISVSDTECKQIIANLVGTVNPISKQKILGGFGASSAQYFLMKWALYQMQMQLQCQTPQGSAKYVDPTKRRTEDLVSAELVNMDSKISSDLWKAWIGDYQMVSGGASGADLTAHLQGGFSYFERKTNNRSRLPFRFANIGFSLFSTGIKIKTHEHLETFRSDPMQLEKALGYEKIVHQLRLSLEENDELLFIDSINNAKDFLLANNWVADSTKALLKKIESTDNNQKVILATKGCGALGADTILVAHRQNIDISSWRRQMQDQLGLIFVAGNQDIAEGILYHE
jgi:mevalonate kinase